MHPSLAPEVLAARKAELCAEARALRREFCDQAAELQPLTQAAQFGWDAMQTFRKSDVAIPSTFGAALGIAVERAFPKADLWVWFLRNARIIAKPWKIIRAFYGIGLQSEIARPQ
jgi:hypothetical protein